MAGGAGNSSYLVTSQNEKYVLTIFDDKSLAHVSQLAKLLGYLATNDFTTTRILLAENNSNPVMRFGNKPVLVKEYITGEVCSNCDEKMLIQVGSSMATLHQISVPDFLPREHPYGKQEFPSVVETKIDAEYEEWLAERCKYLDQYLPKDLPTSLIHGDLFFDNVLFEEGELKALIDFEEACQYYRVFDIGMGIVGMCTETGKINVEKAKAFVRGYQQVQLLEDIEEDRLQLFIEYAAIATSYWRFWKYNIHEPMPTKAQLHQQMVEIANEVASIPQKEFRKALFD